MAATSGGGAAGATAGAGTGGTTASSAVTASSVLEESDRIAIGGTRKLLKEEKVHASAKLMPKASLERAIEENLSREKGEDSLKKRARTNEEAEELKLFIKAASEGIYRARVNEISRKAAEVAPPKSESTRTTGWVKVGKEWVKRPVASAASAGAGGAGGSASAST